MKTICNKTQKPVSVPLPRGKTLHLGPGKTGQIASDADEYPPLKKLIDGGDIEVVGQGSGTNDGPDGSRKGRAAARGYASGGVRHRSGDR